MNSSRRLKLGCIAVAISMYVSGCLIVPVGLFTENPYTKEKLALILDANADRNLVRQQFGAPAFTKENQRYWFYLNRRETVGIIGGHSSAVITDDDWLLVEFDQSGKVVLAEATDFGKCASNGICFDGGEVFADPLNRPVSTALPMENECTIYLYLNKLPWPLPAGTVRYFINGKLIGAVGSDGYLFLTHPQGIVQVSAYDLAISTHCEGGKLLYIRAVKKVDWSWMTGEDLAPVSSEEGAREIKLRHPALLD